MKTSINQGLKGYALFSFSTIINWILLLVGNFILISKLASFVTKLTTISLYSRNELESRYLITLAVLILFNFVLGALFTTCSIYKKSEPIPRKVKNHVEIEEKENE